MLPKSKKMKKEDFSTKERSFSVFSPLFTLKVTKSENPNKYSVVVSKKIAKEAVTRNLIKRRVFSAIRDTEGLFKQKNTYIFFVKNEIKGKKPLEIKAFITKALKNE